MHPYLKLAPARNVRTIERLLRQIAPARLDERLDPERFNPREVIAHLADWEPILRDRIVSVLTHEHFVITPYDESQRAIDNHYAKADITISLATWKRERAETMRVIQPIEGNDYRRPYVHPELGDGQLVDLIAMLGCHDAYHIEQLSEYLEEKTAGTW